LCDHGGLAQRRLTREENKAITRARLLEGAAKVFARRGFHRASVDEIADEAGFSTGALYSNFDGKEDLFLALLDEHLAAIVRDISEAAHQGATALDRARGAAEHFMANLERDHDLILLFIEFWSYAVRDPELRPRIAARLGAGRDAVARMVADGAEELGIATPISPERLGIAIAALANGLALEKLADPDAVPDGLFAEVVTLLLGTLTTAESPTPE